MDTMDNEPIVPVVTEKEILDLREEARAIDRVYKNPDWQPVLKQLQVHCEFFTKQLLEKYDLPEKERAWMMGQRHALQYVMELPSLVSTKLSDLEEALDAADEASSTGPQQGNQEE